VGREGDQNGVKFSPAFFGVLKNLAGFGIDADFLNDFSLLDVEGITQAAATLFVFSSSSVIMPGEVYRHSEAGERGTFAEE